MSYSVYLPTCMEEVDIDDDNIDVCVRTNEGIEYTFVVATELNLKRIPGVRVLVVDQLTLPNIENCIHKIMKQSIETIEYYGKNY